VEVWVPRGGSYENTPPSECLLLVPARMGPATQLGRGLSPEAERVLCLPTQSITRPVKVLICCGGVFKVWFPLPTAVQMSPPISTTSFVRRSLPAFSERTTRRWSHIPYSNRLGTPSLSADGLRQYGPGIAFSKQRILSKGNYCAFFNVYSC